MFINNAFHLPTIHHSLFPFSTRFFSFVAVNICLSMYIYDKCMRIFADGILLFLFLLSKYFLCILFLICEIFIIINKHLINFPLNFDITISTFHFWTSQSPTFRQRISLKVTHILELKWQQWKKFMVKP